ncbi:MAG: cache domain-containing protein, partial [Terriglobales bacterium]
MEETEPVQQTEITRALAEEVQLFESNLYQQLVSERQILVLTGLIDDVNDPTKAPQVARLLENFVQSSPNVLYLTAVGRNAKGSGAGDFAPDRDPFVSNALQRAFTASVQSLRFQSDPLAIGPQSRPAFVMAVPLQVGGQFTGMLAAVVSLDSITRRLQETSQHGRTVYLVDRNGHIVAHPDTRNFVPGADVSSTFPVAAQIKELPRELRTTRAVRFSITENKQVVEMFGTYSTVPDLDWAVIAQRSLNQAREDAGVKELNAQAVAFVAVMTIIALIFGYIFAVAISRPVRSLAASTRAISRGEFHERTPVRGPAEISELAETFNSMAEDIEEFIERLKQA